MARYRWEDGMKMYLKNMGYEVLVAANFMTS
jgi:hypothetical protein